MEFARKFCAKKSMLNSPWLGNSAPANLWFQRKIENALKPTVLKCVERYRCDIDSLMLHQSKAIPFVLFSIEITPPFHNSFHSHRVFPHSKVMSHPNRSPFKKKSVVRAVCNKCALELKVVQVTATNGYASISNAANAEISINHRIIYRKY